MDIQALSACFVTDKVADSREFYMRHFGARLTFDCGWYINLQFGAGLASLQFMAPQEGQVPGNPAGLICNFAVSDVDGAYAHLTAEGLVPVMPLEDHPWGDRGFAVQDPNNIVLYIFTEREPDAEFKQYFKV